MYKAELVSRNNILDKARELSDFIANSNEVDFFKKAEQKIKKNDKVQTLISQIKRKQKEAVNAQHLQKTNLLAQIESELEALNNQLDEIPVVQEFKQTQIDVNDLLQLVTSVISNTVTEKIILSTGGDPLQGKTGLLPDEEE